ncbi:MAG: alpha/beta hydrolase [Patescibacteria group bacterium]|jgi:esterase/lipase
MKKLAILLPGFLDSKDYPHLVDLDEKLKKLEYTTVRLNPTGTWGDSEDASKYTMTQYLADVDAEIKKQGQYDEILLAGHSLGGTIALIYASRHPQVTTTIGIMSPTTYIRDENLEKIEKWKKEGLKTSSRNLPEDETTSRKFILPYSFIEDAEQYDVVKEIPNFHGNMLLIAGELDDCVVPQQLKDIYNVANQPKVLIEMEGIGHDYRHNAREVESVNNNVINFLKDL